MATRIVEGKKPYTGGKAITVDENKVISLNLRDENNLIIYDAGDDEIYVDLQLPDGITPLDAFPVGITVGRVLVADDWDVTGTLACFKTTSGDNIKLLYGDNGKVYIDNGTGLFKQIYLKGEVDALIQALRDYVDAQLALKQDQLIAGDYIEIDNNVISAVIPTMSRFLSIWNASSGEPISFPASTPFLYTTGDYYLIEGVGVSDNYRPTPIEYDGSASTIPETEEVANGDVYIYDGAIWLLQTNHGKTVTFQNIAGDPYDNTNLATALNAKQNTLINQSNIKSINNNSLLGSGDLSISEVPSGGTNGQVLTKTSQGPSWQNATGGADIEYKTQAEYNALPSSKLTDNKHYFIYTSDGGGGWQPGANTVAYYKFEGDLKDYSGNGHDLTGIGNITYITDTGMNKQVAYFQGSSSGNSTGAVSTSFTQQLTPSTFCVRYKAKSNGGSYPNRFFMLTYHDGSGYMLTGLITAWESNADFKVRANSDYKFQTGVYPDVGGGWHCAVATIGEGYAKIYLDGEYKNQNTYSTADVSTSTPILIGSNDSYYGYNGYIGTAIIENRIRTEQEVANYYNQTKSEYGL